VPMCRCGIYFDILSPWFFFIRIRIPISNRTHWHIRTLAHPHIGTLAHWHIRIPIAIGTHPHILSLANGEAEI
jgi:hypothetical protein